MLDLIISAQLAAVAWDVVTECRGGALLGVVIGLSLGIVVLLP